MEHELKIEYLPVSALKPYGKNARKHTPADIDGIKRSILDVGFSDPIGVWGRDNIIVEGHGRLLAAKELHMDKVPCIRLDHLTDAQRREYTIRHNRSAELSSWDFDLLQEELAALDIDGIDMSDISADFDFAQEDLDGYIGDERERSYKGVNLKDYDEHRTDGFYQMPVIQPTRFVPDRLIGFNYARTAKDTDCGIHFFIDDYQFERVWNDPDTNIRLLQKYQCVLTPDWSLYMDMPMAMKIWNIYRSRLIGQMMQDAGIEVIPTLSWAQPETYQFCFDGLQPGGVVAVSTVGIMRSEDARSVWADGMREAIRRLSPSLVLCYGAEPEFFDWGDVKTKTFSAREWGGQ